MQPILSARVGAIPSLQKTAESGFTTEIWLDGPAFGVMVDRRAVSASASLAPRLLHRAGVNTGHLASRSEQMGNPAGPAFPDICFMIAEQNGQLS
jgi:hypothetical protein